MPTEKTLIDAARRLARRIKSISICEICQIRRATDVHHVDEDPFNNSRGNLMGLCPKCHKALHIQRNSRGQFAKVIA
jgi:hypothetical protein